MIVGLGVDIVNINRIEFVIKKWGKKFLQRIFTSREINYCQQHSNSFQHFAARFAAKEAIFKVFGTGWRNISWQEVEIINNSMGKPEVKLIGNAKLIAEKMIIQNIHISLSHEKTYAIAQAIAEGGNKSDFTAAG